MNKSKKVTHAWGIASLVLSIIGLMLIFAPYIGIFCSILAVVFYGIQKKHEPTGVATAGLVIGIIGIVINATMLIFVVGMLALFSSVGTVSDTGMYADNVVNQNTPTTTTQTQTTPPVEDESNKATIGEKNALAKAKSYLRYSAFSYKGLIDQLEFEGFTNQEAKYGADNSGADWNEQAKLKAESYLKYSAFSRQGLIDQLLFEGFTQSQAEYGVNAVGY